MTAEEIRLWESLEEIEDDEDEEEEPKVDVEHTKKACREHINKRIAILKSGKETEMARQDFDALPPFDKMRITFVEEYEVEDDDIDALVMNFLQSRIDNCPHEDIVIGYRMVLEMYDSILGPEFYYLSLWEGSAQLKQHEHFCLFGC